MGKVNRKHFNDDNSQKKERKPLTFSQKKELCEKYRDQNLSGVQLAKEYEISDSMVSDILNSDMQNVIKLKKKILFDSKKKQEQGRIDDFFNQFYCIKFLGNLFK